MANTYKNIVITPNINTGANVVPVIRFSGGDGASNVDINVRIYTTQNGTLSFEGSAGQLFSITNDLTNTIFSVNDISGIPSFEIDANGKVTIAQYSGNVGIGTSNPIHKLDMIGGANITSYLIVNGANILPTLAGTNTAIGTAANTFSSATIAGANTAVGAGANAFLLATIAGANTAVGAGANNYQIAIQNGANVAVGLGANNYANATFLKSVAANQTLTGNLNIIGDLTLSGNTFTIDSTRLTIDDPLIYLAGNNYVSDIVDIGFIANYSNATGANVHTGLYREHTDKMWYLFQGYDQEPINNHIGAFSNNMTLAVLNADLRTSNLLLGGVNAITWITAAYAFANTANDRAIAAFNKANTGGTGGGGAYFQGNNGDVGSVSGLGDIFRVHSNTLTTNVTITSGNNAVAVGPLTIAVNKLLTIQVGARVSIV